MRLPVVRHPYEVDFPASKVSPPTVSSASLLISSIPVNDDAVAAVSAVPIPSPSTSVPLPVTAPRLRFRLSAREILALSAMEVVPVTLSCPVPLRLTPSFSTKSVVSREPYREELSASKVSPSTVSSASLLISSIPVNDDAVAAVSAVPIPLPSTSVPLPVTAPRLRFRLSAREILALSAMEVVPVTLSCPVPLRLTPSFSAKSVVSREPYRKESPVSVVDLKSAELFVAICNAEAKDSLLVMEEAPPSSSTPTTSVPFSP